MSKQVYPHMLRHTMATTLLANGCPIGHIRSLLGHEHLTTTCKYYLGIIAEADVKAAHAKYLSYDIEQGKKSDNGRDREQLKEDTGREHLYRLCGDVYLLMHHSKATLQVEDLGLFVWGEL